MSEQAVFDALKYRIVVDGWVIAVTSTLVVNCIGTVVRLLTVPMDIKNGGKMASYIVLTGRLLSGGMAPRIGSSTMWKCPKLSSKRR